MLGEQFFDADAHPQITFSSDDVVLDEDGTATVDGALTIKGTTRAITAHGTWSPPAADPMGKTRSHLALEATIDRRDYGITWDAPLPNGGSVLADEVTITAEAAMRILGISGSLRRGSHNLTMLRAAAAQLPSDAELEEYRALALIPPTAKISTPQPRRRRSTGSVARSAPSRTR